MESQVIDDINKKVASQFPELNLQFSSPKSKNFWIVSGVVVAVVVGFLLYHYRKLN